MSFELSADDAQKSAFAAYTLGNTNLLPSFFGDVAPINIFIGENNSGKSRFMREIMKSSPVRMISLARIDDDLSKKVALLVETVHSPDDKAIYDIILEVDSSIKQYPLSLFNSLGMDPRAVPRMTINSQSAINKIDLILNSLVIKFIDKRNILDNIYNGSFSKDLEGLEEQRSILKKSKILYEELANAGFKGVNDFYVNGNKAVYSHDGSIIAFETGSNYVSESFRHEYARKNTSSNALSTIDRIVSIANSVINILDYILEQDTAKATKRTYIPTLRTARTLREGKSTIVKDVFKTTTSFDYELDDSRLEVHTGLDLYSAIDEKKNSDMDDREEFEKFEEFLSETFFNGQPVKVVPNKKKTNILVAVGREERALPHLGDGIQAIILLLYPLFIASDMS